MYEELIKSARSASGNSYSPYSSFPVGAALLCADGSVFCGCNVENSSYSATVCAERTALVSAVAAGKRDFSAIAIYTPRACAGFVPCAVCLQALSELCAGSLEIVCVDGSGGVARHTLAELLPFAFRLGCGEDK